MVVVTEYERAPDGILVAFAPSYFRLLEIHPSLTALLTADPIENLRFLEREYAR